MRTAIAALTDALLAGILCACVLMGCAIGDQIDCRHSCCHKHAMQACAYNLLERTEKAVPAYHASAPAAASVLVLPPPGSGVAGPTSPTRLVDATGLFLRIRVLLL